MALFDYRHYQGKASAKLVETSYKLAVYTNFASFSYLPIAKWINLSGKHNENWFPNKVHLSAPTNWRELTPSELGLPASSKDISGYYTIASSATGNRPISGMGPQAKIFGEFKNGKIIKISLAWSGTNDLLDVADYAHFNEGKIAPHMTPLLDAIKAYSLQQGLKGENILITGYSSGGAFTNIMAKHREQLSGGFFKNADYVGIASPLIYDNPNIILNMGFENDAVYRISGNAPTFTQAMKELKPFLVNPDKDYESTMDNIILFNPSYASLFWHPNALSILNIPQGWGAHFNGVTTDAVERIATSTYYEYTQKDSKVIVDALPALQRPFVWVRDKTKVGDASFIIGNDHHNLLADSHGSNYIDAKGGNDKIKVSAGADVIDGGQGIDTLILNGRNTDWDSYSLKNGTLFFHSKQELGLKEAINIEKITFEKDPRSFTTPYEVSENGLLDHRYLIKNRNSDIHYKTHIEGTEESDTLTGKVIFAQGGNDILYAIEQDSLLHGGKGNDVIFGKKGNDQLFGAEGNDIIYAGAGNDVVYGGIGHDVFSFDIHATGRTIIKDFNHHSGDIDTLLFSKTLFNSVNEVYRATTKHGNDLHINKGAVNIVLENTHLTELANTIGII